MKKVYECWAQKKSYQTDAELIGDEACDDGDESLSNSRSSFKRPYNDTVEEVGKHPWGLEKGVKIEEYGSDPICSLSLFNYKVNALVGANRADQKHVLAVLDTEAGPNLIREGCCRKEALTQMRTSTEVVNLSSASRHRLEVLRLVSLTLAVD